MLGQAEGPAEEGDHPNPEGPAAGHAPSSDSTEGAIRPTPILRREQIPSISGTIAEKVPTLPGDINKAREHIRGHLARLLVFTLALFILAILVMLAFSKATEVPPDALEDFFTPTLAALVTLVSTAIGFYYGTASRDHRGGHHELEE